METGDDLLEGADRVLERDKLALVTSEDLGDLERLRHETLDLTRALDGQLVLLRQLVHTENGNDILERLVVLKNLLDGGCNVVVLSANDTRVQHTRLGVKGVDSGVDTKLSNTTGQHSGSVQMGESRGRGRISQIIGRDIDSLDGGDRTLLCGGDTLLPEKK